MRGFNRWDDTPERHGDGGPGFRGPRRPFFFLPLLIFVGVFFMRGFRPGRSGTWMIPPPLIWILGIVAAVGVGFGLWNLFARNRGTDSSGTARDSIDKKLVQIARANDGRIRVGDLVQESNLSLENARKTLDEYVRKGNLTIDYDDSGNVFYRLPGETPGD